MSAPPAPAWRTSLGGIAIASLGQLVISWAAWSLGARAISDDDYARVVIAQQFVAAPSLDPSGTSWLPFPFLLLGLAMSLTQATLLVAQVVTLIQAALSTSLLYAAARVWGSARGWAIFGALLAAALPYAARLSVATVPEYLTAALIVFAAASLTSKNRAVTLAGGGALLLACASRYEAWPAAILFAALQVVQARSPSGRVARLSATLLALLFPLLWMTHGALHHESALFFIDRVADYKKALDGGRSASFSETLLPLRAAFLAEPEITCVALGLLGAAIHQGKRALLRSLFLPWTLPLVIVVTLTVSALMSGAPTHHAERALLSVWLLSALTAARLLEELSTERAPPLLLPASAALLGAALRILGAFEVQPFTDRSAEIRFGREVLAGLPADQKVALALSDYGYFAMMAAVGRSESFVILNKHDPRHHEESEEALARYFASGGCLYVTEQSPVPRAGHLLHDAQLPFQLWIGPKCRPQPDQ
jgi:hypothetical protein